MSTTRILRNSLFLCIALLFVLTISSDIETVSKAEELPKQKAPLSYSLEVDLIQVPVRITDRVGNWITGVPCADLELLEDGVPEQLLYCDELEISSEEKAQIQQEISSAVSQPRRAAPETSQVLLLVFDACNSGQAGLTKQKKYVKEFLKNFPSAGILFSVVEINPAGGYEVVQSMTSNKELLFPKIDQISGDGHGKDRIGHEADVIADAGQLDACRAFGAQAGAISEDCVEAALRSIVNKAGILASQAQGRSNATLQSLKSIFKTYRHLQGQRSVIFVSEGFDPGGISYYNYAANVIVYLVNRFMLPARYLRLVSDLEAHASQLGPKIEEYQNLIQAANTSGLTIYWVDPEYGKNIAAVSSELNVPVGLDSKFLNKANQESAMRRLAEDTGGAALSSSDPSKFFSGLIESIPRYYLLSYKPARPINDGKLHRIEVRSKNKPYKIAFKREFKDFAPEERALRQLSRAQDFPQTDSGFSFLKEVNYFRKSKDEYRVILKVGVPFDLITPNMEEGKVQNVVHLSLLVGDKDDKIIMNEHPTHEIQLPYDVFDQLRQGKQVLELVQNFHLKVGSYSLSLAVMDEASGKTSRELIPLELPRDGQSCLSVSPILLASSSRKSDQTTTVPTATQNGEVLYGENAYRFGIQRVYPKQGSLSGFYQIYNANVPSVFIGFKLYSDKNGFINGTPEREISNFTDPEEKLISNFFSLPFKNLAPGSYELEINVHEKDGSCPASSRAHFEVASEEDLAKKERTLN